MATARPRFFTLDAMRGVAAVLVVLFHLADNKWLPWGPAHAYLAVDLFFALSGFVLARNYDFRFAAGMTVWAFMLKRIIRLFPIYLVAFALGEAMQVTAMVHGDVTPVHFLTTAMSNGLLLPDLAASPHAFMFTAVPPAWSLFYELWVANLLYVVLWRRMLGRGTPLVVAVSGVALLLAVIYYGGSSGGDSTAAIPLALLRVLFSFFAGVQISRLRERWPSKTALPSWLIPVVLAILLCLPVPRPAAVAFDVCCIGFIFPLMIWFGADAAERRPWLGAALGDASYVLYVIHEPLIDAGWRVLWRLHATPPVLLGLLFVPAVVLLALWLHHAVDMPMQRALGRLRA